MWDWLLTLFGGSGAPGEQSKAATQGATSGTQGGLFQPMTSFNTTPVTPVTPSASPTEQSQPQGMDYGKLIASMLTQTGSTPGAESQQLSAKAAGTDMLAPLNKPMQSWKWW